MPSATPEEIAKFLRAIIEYPGAALQEYKAEVGLGAHTFLKLVVRIDPVDEDEP